MQLLGRNVLMEPQILLRILVGRLAISAGRMSETELLGALGVIGEDTVIAVYQHGELGSLEKMIPFS